ncbi:MAG: hypothetical protein ACKV2O_12385 [Acidimicrobiales bacterium]
MFRIPRSRIPRSLIAAGLLGATLAACGGDDAGSDETESNVPEEFGLTLAQLATRVEQTEQLIATCMTTAGFDYVAIDFSTVKKAMDSDQSAPGLSDDAYLKQFGMGITTQFDKPIVDFGAGPQNTTSLNGLPQPDQVAFRRALWGEQVEWNHARALEGEDFSQTDGCTRSSAEQTYSPDELTGAYVNPADRAVEQDPRMVAALGAWSECMQDEGYAYDHPDQVEADLRDQLAAIVQGQDPKALTGPSLEALKTLQGEELAIAEVHTSCEENHIEPVQIKIEAELYGANPT